MTRMVTPTNTTDLGRPRSEQPVAKAETNWHQFTMKDRLVQGDVPDVCRGSVGEGGCTEEGGTIRQHWPTCCRCCYELFRRAVCDDDQQAWESIIPQYRGLILAWVRRQPGFYSICPVEDDDHWVDEVFRRFIGGVTRERFGAFPEVAHLCGYLRLCAITAVRDELRCQNRQAPTVPIEPMDSNEWFAEEMSLDTLLAPAILEPVLDRELRETVVRELCDDQEREVFRLSFIQGYAPREIQQLLPLRFPSVDAIYQTKRRLLTQLRTSQALRDYLS